MLRGALQGVRYPLKGLGSVQGAALAGGGSTPVKMSGTRWEPLALRLRPPRKNKH